MVDMSGEQSVQFVLGGNASQRNEADHIAAATLVFPVLIPDDDSDNMHPETSHLSLEAKSSNSAEQTVVKRKRGRPRKMKPSEEQGQSGKIDASSSLPINQQQPGAAVKSGRPKRSEQTTTKRDLGGPSGGGGAGGEASAPMKRSRGRPKKVATSTETSQSQVLCLQAQPPTISSRHQPIVSSEGITTHGSTDIYNAVQQLAQDAVIVSAIHGTPVQVLPTTAVASMNTIDAEGPLRVSAPISVTISPMREDTGAKWSASTSASVVVSTPPSSRITDEREKRGYGMPIHVYQIGASTPPLLHAEQPEILNSLPQCSLSSGEVSVKVVDRLAAGPKERAGDSHSAGVLEDVRHDTRYLKQPEEGVTVIKRKGAKVDTIAGTSKAVIDSGNQSTKIQEQPAEVKPPQLDPPPIKRKRGRPPKSKSSSSQQSTSVQEQPAKQDTVSSVLPSGGEIIEKKVEPSVEAPVAATDQPAVKRKTGRPQKVKTPKAPSESPVIPPPPPPPPEPTTATITSTTASVNGEENKKPRKRGRPPKSTKAQVQTTEASGEVKVKRGRGRPRKYPIPAVAASGPFLPSVSGITLPAADQNEEQTPTQGSAPPPQIKSKQQQPPPEGSQDSPATVAVEAPVSRKRGRPPKNPDGPPPAKRKPGRPRVLPSPDLTPQKRGRPRKNPPEPAQDSSPPRKRGRPPRANPSPPDPSPRKRGRPKRNPTPDLSPQKRGRPRKPPGEESAPPPRKPGRPKKNPPVPDNEKVSENQPEQQNEQQETEKLERQISNSPKIVAQKETSPVIDVEETTEPQPKRKRGRPKKIPPPVVPPPLQEPTSFSSLVRESSSSLQPGGGAEKPEEEEDDRYSGDAVNLSLQISFSDSDSEHSEKVESNAIMALADRVVAPSPSPPRERDSPLLNPSFEESYDEDSDPDSK